MGLAHGGKPVMLPTDLDDLVIRYKLTRPEAEQVWQRTHIGEDETQVANTVKIERTIYRPGYEPVPATANTLTAAAAARRAEHERWSDLSLDERKARTDAVRARTEDGV